jgi:transposase InsO family protein
MKSAGHGFTPMKKMAVGRPQVFNGDQGSQFTSADFIKMLKTAEIAIRMDGKGAWRDNVRSRPPNWGRPSPVPTRPEGQDARGRTLTIGLKIRGRRKAG